MDAQVKPGFSQDLRPRKARLRPDVEVELGVWLID